MKLARLKPPGDHKFMLFAGDILAVVIYGLDPREKFTVIQRVSDRHDPECNVYRSQVDIIASVDLMLLPRTGVTHAIYARSGNGHAKSGTDGPVGCWSFCGNIFREDMVATAHKQPTDRHKELREFKLCGSCQRTHGWKKAIGK